MSPAKYEGRYISPSQQMTRLDDEGTSYWLEDLMLPSGKTIARADVVHHSEDWLVVRELGTAFSDSKTWTISTAHIVCFQMMEG